METSGLQFNFILIFYGRKKMTNIKKYTTQQIDFSLTKTKEQKELVQELQSLTQEYAHKWVNGKVPLRVLLRINEIKKQLPLIEK